MSPKIEDKLHTKHKIYRDDLYDALGDPYRVILKAKQMGKTPIHVNSKGTLYEILCESSEHQVLLIVARLFDNGHLYIITCYRADRKLQQIYYAESEVLRDE